MYGIFRAWVEWDYLR